MGGAGFFRMLQCGFGNAFFIDDYEAVTYYTVIIFCDYRFIISRNTKECLIARLRIISA